MHIGQWYGKVFECVVKCSARWSFRKNLFWHTRHSYGFTPVCLIWKIGDAQCRICDMGFPDALYSCFFFFLSNRPCAVSCWLHLKISYCRRRTRTFFYETGSPNGPPLRPRRSLSPLYPRRSRRPRHLLDIDPDERRKLPCL